MCRNLRPTVAYQNGSTSLTTMDVEETIAYSKGQCYATVKKSVKNFYDKMCPCQYRKEEKGGIKRQKIVSCIQAVNRERSFRSAQIDLFELTEAIVGPSAQLCNPEYLNLKDASNMRVYRKLLALGSILLKIFHKTWYLPNELSNFEQLQIVHEVQREHNSNCKVCSEIEKNYKSLDSLLKKVEANSFSYLADKMAQKGGIEAVSILNLFDSNIENILLVHSDWVSPALKLESLELDYEGFMFKISPIEMPGELAAIKPKVGFFTTMVVESQFFIGADAKGLLEAIKKKLKDSKLVKDIKTLKLACKNFPPYLGLFDEGKLEKDLKQAKFGNHYNDPVEKYNQFEKKVNGVKESDINHTHLLLQLYSQTFPTSMNPVPRLDNESGIMWSQMLNDRAVEFSKTIPALYKAVAVPTFASKAEVVGFNIARVNEMMIEKFNRDSTISVRFKDPNPVPHTTTTFAVDIKVLDDIRNNEHWLCFLQRALSFYAYYYYREIKGRGYHAVVQNKSPHGSDHAQPETYATCFQGIFTCPVYSMGKAAGVLQETLQGFLQYLRNLTPEQIHGYCLAYANNMYRTEDDVRKAAADWNRLVNRKDFDFVFDITVHVGILNDIDPKVNGE